MIERIMKLIADNKISECALEKKLGFSQYVIGNWRKGKNKVSTEAIIKLATYFNVSADYLLCLSDEPTSIKKADIIEHHDYALSTEFAELTQDDRFVDSTKLYRAMPNEYKQEVCAYILGIAVGLGLNVQQILGR